MQDWTTVLLRIAVMFLVILVGWVARRRAFLSQETTTTLSSFLVDVTFPALVFTQMLRTVTPASLAANWYVPVIGAAVLVLGFLVGLATCPLFGRPGQRRTYVFLVAVSNWVYLPLPIATALYGEDGMRAVLLANVGAQLMLWTLGVWTIQGGRPNLRSLVNLATNPGLIATAVGIVTALVLPGAQTLHAPGPGALSGFYLVATIIVQALTMVGDLTVPLSLIVTGAQLGGIGSAAYRPSVPMAGVLLSRLVLTPLFMVALVALLMRLGVAVDAVPYPVRMVAYLMAFMPVAVSCSVFTERFGGDTELAARSVFWSTLLSIATVPILFYFVGVLGL